MFNSKKAKINSWVMVPTYHFVGNEHPHIFTLEEQRGIKNDDIFCFVEPLFHRGN